MNCGAEFAGSYCPTCGQASNVRRYSVEGLGFDLYNQFRKFEISALLNTFWDLIERPGAFVRDYLEGKRVDHVNPIKYFFYSFLLQLSAAYIINLLTGSDTSSITEDSDFRSQIIDLIATIFWGLCWWIVFRRSGLNLTENIVAAFFFTGQTFMFTLILRLAFGPFMPNRPELEVAFAVTDLFIYLAYTFFFTRRLFQEPALSLLWKNIVLLVVYVIFFVLILLGASALGVSN